MEPGRRPSTSIREVPLPGDGRSSISGAGLDLPGRSAQTQPDRRYRPRRDGGPLDALPFPARWQSSDAGHVDAHHLRPPAEHEEEYADDVRSQGNRSLFGQAFVDRDGHCKFTPAELIAGIRVLEERVETGRWSAASVNAGKLNQLASSFGLGESASVHSGQVSSSATAATSSSPEWPVRPRGMVGSYQVA